MRYQYLSLSLMLVLIGIISGFSSDLVEVQVATNRILVLHFDDGYVEHYGLGGSGNDDVLHKIPLSVSKCAKVETFTLLSADDPNFAEESHPSEIGRKSKGKDFTQNWGIGLPFISEHWIYLRLPQPLQNGCSYTIKLDRLAQNTNEILFVYDDREIRSETVHVNQIGYAPNSPEKFAYLSHWMGDIGPLDLDGYADSKFHLIDQLTKNIVFTGDIQKRKDLESGGSDCAYDDHAPYGSFTGADVWLIDFTEFNTVGEYRIAVDGIGASYPFRIHPDVYRESFYTTIHALYHQRCGIALEAPYTEWTRDRCHHPAETDTVILSEWMYMNGVNAFTQLPETATDEKKPYVGGWHDAADWDRHHYHLEAAKLLLMAYELKPENFTDDELNIPESGNGIPDILDEARWCVDFYKSMQEEDGGIHGGIETHRHPGTGISAVTDTDQWYAYAPDPIASFHYAAVACAMAYALEIAGFTEDKQDYIRSAQKAYSWAKAWTGELDEEQQRDLRDMRQFAAAWLYKVTGESDYQTQFKVDNMVTTPTTELELWLSHAQEWAIYTFVMTDQQGMDTALKSMLEQAVKNWAYSDHINSADRRGYQYGNDWWYPIAWGAATRPRVFPVYMAYHVSGDEKYLAYVYTTCDYILGANPLNMCWITGLGEKHPKEVMHLDSWYYNQEKGMVPGIIPFGPTAYTDDSPDGPWEISWGQKTAYPDASQWPSHELYFDNRYCPPQNEFTVHNSIGPAAAAFGLLCQAGGKYTKVEQTGEPRCVLGCTLFPGYPNPFNPRTTITYKLAHTTHVKLTIYDVLGRDVIQLVDKQKTAGQHNVVWDATDNHGERVAAGLYFCRMQAEDVVDVIKLALVK